METPLGRQTSGRQTETAGRTDRLGIQLAYLSIPHPHNTPTHCPTFLQLFLFTPPPHPPPYPATPSPSLYRDSHLSTATCISLWRLASLYGDLHLSVATCISLWRLASLYGDLNLSTATRTIYGDLDISAASCTEHRNLITATSISLRRLAYLRRLEYQQRFA